MGRVIKSARPTNSIPAVGAGGNGIEDRLRRDEPQLLHPLEEGTVLTTGIFDIRTCLSGRCHPGLLLSLAAHPGLAFSPAPYHIPRQRSNPDGRPSSGASRKGSCKS